MGSSLTKTIIAVAGSAILVATFLVYGRKGLKQATISIAILVAAVVLTEWVPSQWKKAR